MKERNFSFHDLVDVLRPLQSLSIYSHLLHSPSFIRRKIYIVIIVLVSFKNLIENKIYQENLLKLNNKKVIWLVKKGVEKYKSF